MTAQPPDPDPADTPGLEPGGGVAPGDTPPDSAHVTQSANTDPTPARRFTPGAIAAFAIVGIIAAVFLVVAILRLLEIAGVFR
jgi:hypothetical protein